LSQLEFHKTESLKNGGEKNLIDFLQTC